MYVPSHMYSEALNESEKNFPELFLSIFCLFWYKSEEKTAERKIVALVSCNGTATG